MQKTLQILLASSENGFRDFDIVGHETIRRVTVGDGIKNGEMFNVYHADGAKTGGVWKGSVESSLFAMK
jgi:hypothetical protein